MITFIGFGLGKTLQQHVEIDPTRWDVVQRDNLGVDRQQVVAPSELCSVPREIEQADRISRCQHSGVCIDCLEHCFTTRVQLDADLESCRLEFAGNRLRVVGRIGER